MKTVTVVTELRAGGNEVGFNAAYPEGMDACPCLVWKCWKRN